MCQDNFHLKYRPGKFLSLDEGSCRFRGRVKFLTYNKDKPQKWAMKFFEVADSKNGYVCGLDIYCGKNETSCTNNAQVIDPDCTQTTRTVIGLLDSVQLLGKGHIVYLDNFYNSYQLNLQLYARDTFVCGMLRSNRKGNSKAVVTAKLKNRPVTGWGALSKQSNIKMSKERPIHQPTHKTIHGGVYTYFKSSNRIEISWFI